MKDIILPSETSDAIDLGAIDNTTIVKSAQGSEYSEDTLIELVKRLIKDKVADNFKLINFTIDLDNYNPDKLSLDTKKLMNKKNVWSL